MPFANKKKSIVAKLAGAALSACALALLTGSSAFAASVSRSIDVNATPSMVWSAIGPFCTVQDWLPPIGTCTEDGKTPPTRTLVTKDGKATFVELQTARNDKEFSYSYAFVSSPLPVTKYVSTIKVVAKGDGLSTIIWSSTYLPHAGKEVDADRTLIGVYEAGLQTIKNKFSK